MLVFSGEAKRGGGAEGEEGEEEVRGKEGKGVNTQRIQKCY